MASKVDWAKALRIDQAVKNLHVEMVGDWHQDPWGWPELEYISKKNPDLLVERLNATGALQAALIDVPKENWGTRPAVVLDVRDRLGYQALVDRFSVDLIGKLSPNAFGWRLPPKGPKPGEYSHNSKQWERYREHLSLLAGTFEVALATDIVSCFATIPPGGVQEMIDDRCPSSGVANRLQSFVGDFGKITDRSGLVQRSTASATLANMYLQPLDDVLKHHASPLLVALASGIQYHSFARWMDDMWLFTNDAAAARAAQMDLQAAAHTLGLNLNSGKTDVYEGAEVAVHALQIAHSAVDDGIAAGLLMGTADFGPLEELVDKLLERPEGANRTSLKFALQRMRENNVHSRLHEIALLAKRMPHAADSLSRFFKETATHSSMQDWYLEYVKSDWATHQWAIAQLGRTFPSATRVRKPLREFFASKVRDANTALPLLAVAAQRLSVWDDSEARDACRDAFGRASSAQARRVLALTALGAGEGRRLVRKWLEVDEENWVTLAMLEARSFVSPKVTADFAS